MDFYDTLLVHGLRLNGSPLADGKVHRVKTDSKPKHKNGWYWLSLDGRRGVFGDYTVGLRAEWKADAAAIQLIPKLDPAKIAAQQAAARKITGLAIAGAQKCWHHLRPMSLLHPYLKSKNLTVQGCDAIRIDDAATWFRAWYRHQGVELHIKDDLIVVPMYRAGQLVSVQAIAPNGKKLFWKDAPTKGCSLPLKRINATITIVTEGFATGLCLFQCIPNATVIICFSADNMVAVAADLKLTGMAVVAADNDHATERKTGTNPGIDKAKIAAQAIGCDVVYPQGIQGSDWCDAYAEWNSPARVRSEVLRAVRGIRRVQHPA